MQPDEARRHPDGSIDYDFYRAKARALRGQATRDLLRAISLGKAALIVAAALAVAALAVAPAHWGDVAGGIRKALEAAAQIG